MFSDDPSRAPVYDSEAVRPVHCEKSNRTKVQQRCLAALLKKPLPTFFPFSSSLHPVFMNLLDMAHHFDEPDGFACDVSGSRCGVPRSADTGGVANCTFRNGLSHVCVCACVSCVCVCVCVLCGPTLPASTRPPVACLCRVHNCGVIACAHLRRTSIHTDHPQICHR